MNNSTVIQLYLNNIIWLKFKHIEIKFWKFYCKKFKKYRKFIAKIWNNSQNFYYNFWFSSPIITESGSPPWDKSWLRHWIWGTYSTASAAGRLFHIHHTFIMSSIRTSTWAILKVIRFVKIFILPKISSQ